ncbi:MAG: histidine ammonia-lyase [Syntrophothermus sp.]
MRTVSLDGLSLDIDSVVAVARRGARVELTPDAIQRVKAAEEFVARLVREERVVYGITTGFGKFSEVVISREEAAHLQRNLILSHATGVGPALPEDTVRAIMLLRANALARGNSGIRLVTLERLLEMINRGVHPLVPAKGSVGASGDLAPLAHIALVLIGEGEAFYEGKLLPGGEAMRRAGLEPVVLEAKEGLALINGTQVMTGIGALAVHDAAMLLKVADIAGAMSLEALKGTMTAFAMAIQKVRPHPGQQAVSANFHLLTQGSEIIESHKNCSKVQDAYSLRCIPQVHGASRDALGYVRQVLITEMNSVTDNPLIFLGEDWPGGSSVGEDGGGKSDLGGAVVSGGNFHGQPVAIAMDFLGIALSEMANIAERRVERMLNPQLSGLPAFLAERGGLNSGLMISQYTAAALVSENKVLASPASVDSIPTSANQEDHVSMGTIAARKAVEILENVRHVLAIELLCASQGLDFQRPLLPGKGTKRAYEVIRAEVPHLENDRVIYSDINKVYRLIAGEVLVSEVEKAVGELV